MRIYILDDLVSPASGRPFTLNAAVTVERDGPPVERCKQWCGRQGATPDHVTEDDCAQCQRTWVKSGELTDGERRYPIENGIPRFVSGDDATIDAATQESFAYEWQRFDRMLPEYDDEVQNYFSLVSPEIFRGATVLDAGCGMARWARHVATLPVRRLYAADFSRAIDVAARTLEQFPSAHCIQADICHLPFRASALDFTYCLGVLHHLDDPDAGMREITRVTQGSLLVYLYYALDNRPPIHRWILGAVTALRALTVRLPKPVMHPLSWAIAVAVYWPLARAARVSERAGFGRLADQIPLSHYRTYSLRFMVGDAFDRFATPIEKRYSRPEIAAWLARYGRETQFSNRTPFWVALATPRT